MPTNPQEIHTPGLLPSGWLPSSRPGQTGDAKPGLQRPPARAQQGMAPLMPIGPPVPSQGGAGAETHPSPLPV